MGSGAKFKFKFGYCMIEDLDSGFSAVPIQVPTSTLVSSLIFRTFNLLQSAIQVDGDTPMKLFSLRLSSPSCYNTTLRFPSSLSSFSQSSVVFHFRRYQVLARRDALLSAILEGGDVVVYRTGTWYVDGVQEMGRQQHFTMLWSKLLKSS